LVYAPREIERLARMNEFTSEPVHDKFSHAAEAFRRFAVTHKPNLPELPDERWVRGYATRSLRTRWLGWGDVKLMVDMS
jgi:hypothetical protein